MTAVTIRVDSEVIEAAAKALGLWTPDTPPAALGLRVLRETGGTQRRLAAASGGAAPKRAGRAWENQIVTHANERGFAWDRAPLRGSRDLLDVTGCLPDGWLIGGKSVAVGVRVDQKLSDGMHQCHRALGHVADGMAAIDVIDVIPWQIIQRRGSPVGQAYAVTEYDWMLRLAHLRKEAWGAR